MENNNQANVIGIIDSEFERSHEIYGETFYMFMLKVSRLSGAFDYLKTIVSERLLSDEEFHVGDRVEIIGQFRSYNSYDSKSNRLILSVFAKEILHTDDTQKNPNQIYLNGFICKQPIYRTTPFGREITDLLLAVNRTYNKSDYIPIIAWGRNARYTKNLNVGDNVKIYGRIQSRTYQKRLSEEEVVTKTAYEVSINRLELVTGNEEEPEQEDTAENTVPETVYYHPVTTDDAPTF